MKTVVIFLLFAAVALKATAAPVEEAPEMNVELVEEPKSDIVEDLPEVAPEVYSQYCYPDWEFFRGSCYYVNRNSNSWKNAASYCANFGATLAAVHSPLEYNHFQYMVGRAGFSVAWIGGYHFESSWRWQDGSLFTFDNFASGGAGTTHKCLRMSTQAAQGWSSTPCSYTSPSICQIKVHC